MTKTRWRSIVTDFQNGAVTVSLAFLRIEAANALVMCIRDQIES